MKKYLIALAFAITLGTTAQAASQKHRHHPAVTAVAAVPDSVANDEGVEAYSDTTSTASVDDDNEYAEDGGVIGVDFDDEGIRFADKMLDRFGGVFAFFGMLLLFLFLCSPLLILAFIVWLIVRNRNRRYKLAEKAMETGQAIPQEFLRTERQNDEFLWKKGIKNAALGLGLVAFFYCLGADPLAGIGWLVAFYGVGQAVIAKTSSRKKSKLEEENENQDFQMNTNE